MTDRAYRILVAKDRAGIFALAGDEWTVLENTIKEFQNLGSDDDLSFGDIGGIVVDGQGVLALAWR